MDLNDSLICPLCKKSTNAKDNLLIFCNVCNNWYHRLCVGLCDEVASVHSVSDLQWTCPSCVSQIKSQTTPCDDADLIVCPLCCDKFFKGTRGLRIHWSRAHPHQPFGDNQSTQAISDDPFYSHLASYKNNIKVMRRIPKGARSYAADKLSQIIDRCVSQNTVDCWKDLFIFSYIALQVPLDSKKKYKKSLVSTIKDNLRDFRITSFPIREKHNSPMSRLIEAKVSDGDIRGAVRILSSDMGLASHSLSTFEALLEKHPAPSRPLSFPEPPVSTSPSLSVSLEMVNNAINRFPKGSSSGIDGLRPQHISDLTSTSAGDSGRRLLLSITSLCNFILAGKVIDTICPLLYGATLIALEKKGGGIRPIAIGNVFRRLVSKLACLSVRKESSEYFLPHQLGFGTSNGCEAIIHSVRTFLANNEKSSKVLLKIDFRNAFNCIERDCMLNNVREKIPELYAFLWQAYRFPSNLYFQSHVISSQRGAQQGDPTGPLLFSLTIHPVVKELESCLNLFYLDDGTLCDEPDKVLADFQKVVQDCQSLGLEINPNKCELYFCSGVDDTVVSNFRKIAPGIRVISKSELALLGSPIFVENIESTAHMKIQEMKRSLERLLDLNAHVAYFLLKNCFAIPKFTYYLRTTPLWFFPSVLKEADGLLRNCLESILNFPLEDKNWRLSSLPINLGGLGIRTLSDICLPAFIASAYSVFDFVKSQVSNYGDNLEVCHLTEALQHWSQLTDSQDPPEQREIQKHWDIINSTRVLKLLTTDMDSLQDQARFHAIQAKEASSWLSAIPSTQIGTLMDNCSFRIAGALRLGCKICHEHTCVCGASADSYGHHALSCSKNSGRFSRHSALNDIIKRALTSAGVPSILEPVGISRSDGKRPDGLTLIPWRQGKSLMWDATCVDTVAPSHLSSTCKLAGSAAESAVQLKRSKYRAIIDNYIFVVFAVETLGPWCSEAKAFVSELGKHLQSITNDPRATEYLRQRIGIAIQRGNAASIMGTFPPSSSLEEIFYF